MDVEGTMQFILDNLASVTAKQEKAETEIQALRKLVTVGMKILVRVQNQQENSERKIGALADAQIRLEGETEKLLNAIEKTNERFDRWLESGNGANGHGKKPN